MDIEQRFKDDILACYNETIADDAIFDSIKEQITFRLSKYFESYVKEYLLSFSDAANSDPDFLARHQSLFEALQEFLNDIETKVIVFVEFNSHLRLGKIGID